MRSPPRRTTIILEKEEREFIESLIREGKEPGIKPLISKMLDVYRSMMIYDWRFPGEYYCGISRIAFVNVELLNILSSKFQKRNGVKSGKNGLCPESLSGNNLRSSRQHNVKTGKHVFERLRVQGFGDFFLKDKYLLLKTPFIDRR
jgi:hypothetical protein